MKRRDTLVVFSFKIYRMEKSAPHTQLGTDFLEVFAIFYCALIKYIAYLAALTVL